MQVLGQAFGGKTFKLKFGHHGGNHPLRHTPTGRIEISSQNHNFAVDTATLPDEVEVRPTPCTPCATATGAARQPPPRL